MISIFLLLYCLLHWIFNIGIEAVFINFTDSISSRPYKNTEIFYISSNGAYCIYSGGIITMSMSDSARHSSVANDPKIWRVALKLVLTITVIF